MKYVSQASPGRTPAVEAALKPPGVGVGSRAVDPREAPLRGALVEPLPRPLGDDQRPAGPERCCDVPDHLADVRHVVERSARDDRVDGLLGLELLEADLVEAGSRRGIGVDSGRVVATLAQPRHEAARRAAPELEDGRRRGRQPGADEWPHGGRPALGVHAGDPIRVWYNRPT